MSENYTLRVLSVQIRLVTYVINYWLITSQALKSLCPSAKADGKESKETEIFFLVFFIVCLPSALTDGAGIFGCLNSATNSLKVSK